MTLLISVLILGMLASLSPSTIVVFILLLATTRARVNAAAFLIGWTFSLVLVFTVTYLLGGAHTLRHGGGHTVVAVVEILLGLTLVGVGVRQWRRRDEPRQPKSGASHRLVDRMKELNPIEATMVGVLKQPWTITAAAAVIIVRHHAALLVALAAFVIFTVASTATVGLTYLYYSRRPGEAEARLAALRERLVAAGPALFAVVAVAVGVYLGVDGLRGLAGS